MKIKKIRIFGILILLLFALPGGSYANWQFITPMPHGRYGHDATLGPDGKIYVMGGIAFEIVDGKMTYSKYNDGRYSNLVYDPENDSWEYLEPVPGWGDPDHWMTYDPEKKQWQYHGYRHGMTIPDNVRKTNLERQGNGARIVTGHDGKIYWIGGQGKRFGNGEDIVLPYDPLNRVWAVEVIFEKADPKVSGGHKMIFNKEIPNMGQRRIDHCAVTTSDGRIFVMGGYRLDMFVSRDNNPSGSGAEVLSTMEYYDPKTKEWRYRTPLSTFRMLFAAVATPDDKIYVFGGAAGMSTRQTTPILDTVEVYDPQTDTWSSRKPMPVTRKSHDAVLGADGKIYIMGGTAVVKGPPLNDVFVYDPMQDSWEKGPSMKYPRASPAAVATPDGKIYITGGTDVGAYDGRRRLNYFLPKSLETYTGKVQDTVEVLDIFNQNK